MVEAAGFRVQSLRMLRNSDWLCRSARLARKHGQPGPALAPVPAAFPPGGFLPLLDRAIGFHDAHGGRMPPAARPARSRGHCPSGRQVREEGSGPDRVARTTSATAIASRPLPRRWPSGDSSCRPSRSGGAFSPDPHNCLAQRRADVVVLQRKLLAVAHVRLLRCVAPRLVYDVDDAVFQRDSYHRKGPHSRKLRRRFRAAVAAADAVIAGNDYLRQRAAEHTEPGADARDSHLRRSGPL